jgi:hypothetical protein
MNRLGISATRLVLAGALLWSLPSAAFAIDGTPTWLQSQVHTAPTNTYVSTPALAFDHYGTPALSWSLVSTVGGTNTVYCSQLSGLGFWAHNELATGPTIGLRTSLAFDRAERPAVAWVNLDNTVKGRFNFGSVQQIATNANTNRPVVSLGYDLAGDLRGMYAATTPPAGGFSSVGYSGGSFSSSSLFTISGAGTILDAAIATDHRGLRNVIAREEIGGGASGGVLVASESTGGGWTSTRLVSASAVNGVDIAVDPTDGRIALAYTTFDGGSNRSRLYYAKFNGFSLQTTEVLSSTDDSFEDLSLAFDPTDGRPAIAFEREVASPYSKQLQLAYLNASSQWITSVVDASISLDAPGYMPRGPSLAFDDYGTSWPAIAYVDGDESVCVAFDPPAPEPGTVLLLGFAICLTRLRRF